MSQVLPDQLFTCLSCSIAFLSAEEQSKSTLFRSPSRCLTFSHTGDHYRSDHHRYNMKRRVASLPPVSLSVFNQKVLERRSDTAVAALATGATCETCSKTYSSENAFRSHLNSKKHKETELKAARRLTAPAENSDNPTIAAATPTLDPIAVPSPDDSADADDIDAKIASSRSRLSPEDCLFCPVHSSSLDDNLTHMSSSHSFFIPDADYLTDLVGLIQYLGEKVAVGNVCLYCNAKSREFRTLEAVRKHMLDKAHCKIAYDLEDDRLEMSDYYDFTTSYPTKPSSENEEWEDVDDDSDSANDTELVDDEDDKVDLDADQLTYGDSHLELVLPSGARIGHRSMRRYYAQSFTASARRRKDEDPNSGAALVRRLLADKNSALVPRRGGFGAFGSGTDVVKARNRGEAREAGRHVREFRDQKRREDFKTRIGFGNNHQKHFRDPLLQ